MKTVLVTGGAGYIGSHTCKALSAAGFLPVAYDKLIYGHRYAVKWGPLEIGDIRDRARLDEILVKYRPVAVLHFAAFAYVGESVLEPGKYYINNVVGTLELLEAMRAREINSIVFSSTCATYGIPAEQPITEQVRQEPVNPYGRGKLMIERILADYSAAYGTRSVALRYFNACGADPDGETGEDHEPETHLIPRGLMAAAGEIPHLDLYGTDYNTPDGTCIRDYIHVTDLADAHVRALQYLREGGKTTAFNLGTGHGFSVRNVIETIERVTGRTVPVNEMPQRPGDPPALIAKPDRAEKIIGFSPDYTELDAIIATAWRWYEKIKAHNFRE
jgi:UDP-glucose-4-epimerase GalE